jgi:signal transduction histidine kinase
VVDDGPRLARPAPPTGGYGLLGLRERAALVGGQLTAAHTPSGGFAVTATLPLIEGES